MAFATYCCFSGPISSVGEDETLFDEDLEAVDDIFPTSIVTGQVWVMQQRTSSVSGYELCKLWF